MKNADTPAMPLISKSGLWNLTDGHPDSDFLGQEDQSFSIGVTKREMFAMAAMQGLCTSTAHDYGQTPKGIAKESLRYADALLKALEDDQ